MKPQAQLKFGYNKEIDRVDKLSKILHSVSLSVHDPKLLFIVSITLSCFLRMVWLRD
ncbi:hypothetical protein HPP92_003414 [Vanilla planifolia]|uniref:Uncharacterized protein n=1 Tax=Vanilla planifolia TaxID=51239 RepID=A0A835S7E9_VANPL|nr:hypothetical protein HPP92_003414 [Vanilla planifolia]